MAATRWLRTTITAAVGIVAMLAVMFAPPAGAQSGQLQDGTCPSSVDTTAEGWICSMLILETPAASPSADQIALWSDVLDNHGRIGVSGGIVFSDASVNAKVRTIYETQLGREPDAAGLSHWRQRVQDAHSEFAAEFPIFGSGEYLSQFESTEAFVNDQYQYYLGREASREEQAYWARRFSTTDLSNEGITRAIAHSAEAGRVRARILYRDYARRRADAGGLEFWSRHASESGLFAVLAFFGTADEVVHTLGRVGQDLAAGTPGTAQQDYVVAPQEVVTANTGDPQTITVLQRRDGQPIEGPLDLTLFPCDNVTATDSPVAFADANGDDLADGIASTAQGQAYISEVNGQPTGGRSLYIDDAEPGADGTIEFQVIAGPNPDCAVIAVIEDSAPAQQLSLDGQNHAVEPFGVTKVIWE